MKGQYIIIYTTFSDIENAKKCIDILLKNRLIACCHISQIESVYRWKGNIEKSKEYKIEMKSKKMHSNEIIKTIKENHNYEVPEIVICDITDGSASYMQWIDDEVR